MWTVGAVVVSLGVDRLFVSPLLAHRIGKAAFDAFQFVRDFTTLFSNIAGSGFRLHFLRNLVRMDADDKRQAVRSAAVLISGITCIAFPVAALAVAAFAMRDQFRSGNDADSWALFLPFGVYGLARAMEFVISVNLRVRRKFYKLFLLRLAEGAALVSLVLLLPSVSLAVVGWMYAASMVLPLLLSLVFNRDIVAWGSFVDGASLRGLATAAPPGAILAGLESAQTLLPRLFLFSLATGDGRLTALFAGMSIVNLFISPAGFMSQLVLSLLAGKREFDLTARQGRLYLTVILASAAFATLIAYVAGRITLPWIWSREPQIVAESIGFFHWLALAIGCLAVRDMLKPFAVKFLPMRMVIAFSAIPLIVQVIALVLLIPRYQGTGAAVALAISSLIAMLSWIAAFEYLRRTARVIPENEPDDI